MTDAQMRTLRPPVAQVGISSQPPTIGGSGTKTPLVFGQVETTFVNIAGTEVDDCADSPVCVKLAGTSPPSVNNTLGIQNNTNNFNYDSTTAVYNNWVQFVVYSNAAQDPSTGNALCIWNIQLNPTNDFFSHTRCVDGQIGELVYTVPKRAGAFQRFDFATIAGYTFTDANNVNQLGMVTELSWVTSNTPRRYAVVTPDTYGLAGNWYDVSGGIVGIANGSNAEFTNDGGTNDGGITVAGGAAEVVTRITASSCQGDTEASSAICPSQPALLPLVSLLDPGIGAGWIAGQNAVTAEGSNLQNVGSPSALISLNADLVATE